MSSSDETPCAVRDAGIMLRSACEGCNGHPSCGQRSLAPRDVLYLGGAPADAIYCVVEGLLKESVTTKDGQILGVRLARPGELVGTETMVGEAYQCTVEALTPSRVCRVSEGELDETLAARPEQGVAIARTLGRELQQLRSSMVRLSSMTAEEKVRVIVEELLGDSKPGVWIRLPLSRQELAELLGLTLPTVSRTVRRLAREGSYEVSGRRIRRL